MLGVSDEPEMINTQIQTQPSPWSLKNGAGRREEKRENIQLKIPSSLGLFIVDSSCFFVSGPVVGKTTEYKRSELKKIGGQNGSKVNGEVQQKIPHV